MCEDTLSNFCTNYTDSASTIQLQLINDAFWLFSLYLNTNLYSIYFPVDLILFFTTKNNIENYRGFILFFCYFMGVNLNVKFVVEGKLLSLSYIYSGLSWVERELKEFNSIFISGMRDTRKLLTNYSTVCTESKNRSDVYYNFFRLY
jgi:hypothetical protein